MPGKIPPAERPPTDTSALDLPAAALLLGLALDERVAAEVAAAGFDGIRFNHAFLFQSLQRGQLTVGELAEDLGVSAQSVSKTVGDLEALGYVERRYDRRDARVRQVGLTERGEAAVAAGREARRRLEAELQVALGDRRVAAARKVLVEALDRLGGADAVRARRAATVDR